MDFLILPFNILRLLLSWCPQPRPFSTLADFPLSFISKIGKAPNLWGRAYLLLKQLPCHCDMSPNLAHRRHESVPTLNLELEGDGPRKQGYYRMASGENGCSNLQFPVAAFKVQHCLLGNLQCLLLSLPFMPVLSSWASSAYLFIPDILWARQYPLNKVQICLNWQRLVFVCAT